MHSALPPIIYSLLLSLSTHMYMLIRIYVCANSDVNFGICIDSYIADMLLAEQFSMDVQTNRCSYSISTGIPTVVTLCAYILSEVFGLKDKCQIWYVFCVLLYYGACFVQHV